jgi:prephenate dehydrogenase
MRLVVVGTGLIGGSFALAARQAGVFDEVLGVEPNAAQARRAVAAGIADRIVPDVPADADAVLLALPCDRIPEWVATLAEHSGIVFDAGSVKGGVLDAVRALRGDLPSRFVPCHPIAGSEQSGPDAASPRLFVGQEVIVTPDAATDADAVARVSDWWRATGARVTTMTATQHDEVFAVTSHLPHLVAFAYLQGIEGDHLAHAAGGFRDFTRIGASEPAVWAPIFALNRNAVLAALDGLQDDLEKVRVLIASDDRAALAELLADSRARRLKFRPPA